MMQTIVPFPLSEPEQKIIEEVAARCNLLTEMVHLGWSCEARPFTYPKPATRRERESGNVQYKDWLAPIKGAPIASPLVFLKSLGTRKL